MARGAKVFVLRARLSGWIASSRAMIIAHPPPPGKLCPQHPLDGLGDVDNPVNLRDAGAEPARLQRQLRAQHAPGILARQILDTSPQMRVGGGPTIRAGPLRVVRRAQKCRRAGEVAPLHDPRHQLAPRTLGHAETERIANGKPRWTFDARKGVIETIPSLGRENPTQP